MHLIANKFRTLEVFFSPVAAIRILKTENDQSLCYEHAHYLSNSYVARMKSAVRLSIVVCLTMYWLSKLPLGPDRVSVRVTFFLLFLQTRLIPTKFAVLIQYLMVLNHTLFVSIIHRGR